MKNITWTLFCVGMILGIALVSCHASEHMRIQPCDTRDYRQCAIIAIAGEITDGDGNEFLERTKDIQSARVDLQGPGGAFIAAIAIGEQVHAKGFSTAVPANAKCASACANIWIAGSRRETGQNSILLWHAVYSLKDPANADGMANAMLGVYLAHLGFNYIDVIRMFGHNPTDMHETLTDANGVQTRADLKAGE